MSSVGLSLTITTNFEEGPGIDLGRFIGAQQLKLAVETGLALLKRRITLHHKRADGRSLSTYANDPVNIPIRGAATGSPMVRPKGGVRSKSKKSMHFKGGYVDYRKKAGRTDKKDFTLSGNLMGKRFRVLRAGGGKAVVGWSAGSKQGLVAHGLNKQENGKAFLWSENEQTAIVRAASFFIQLYMTQQGWAGPPPPLNIRDLE